MFLFFPENHDGQGGINYQKEYSGTQNLLSQPLCISKMFLFEVLPLPVFVTLSLIFLLKRHGQQMVLVRGSTTCSCFCIRLYRVKLVINEHCVPLNILQCFPDNIQLVEEALVSDQQVEVGSLLLHGGEVIFSEEHG